KGDMVGTRWSRGDDDIWRGVDVWWWRGGCEDGDSRGVVAAVGGGYDSLRRQFVGSGDEMVDLNNAEDATFDGKEHDFDVKKPESKVILLPSSSAQSKEQDDKTKKEAKEKSPIKSITGYRDLNAKFEDCSENSSNEVNAASSLVPTAGHNFINSTNNFSAAVPSNTTVSPTYENSSFQDASTSSYDPDMPALEDFTYSDDEAAVGAEADINSLGIPLLETFSLSVSCHRL
nr:hypothetical protein [Tanacetum cinerariifolium]